MTLVGYAQSNARVSTLMRNIESSPWLTSPELVEIKSVPLDKQKVNEFTLNLQVKRQTRIRHAPGAPGKPAVPATRRERGQGMTLDDIRRLNIREAGNWPLLPKIVILGILLVLIFAAGGLLRLE